ncbi:MAG: haloacid dehalogenase type II, partial [Pyrinomonadaceae bacterium]
LVCRSQAAPERLVVELSLGRTMLDLQRYEVLSFDCYGTLIDWESGILSALREVVTAHGVKLGDAQILELYAELEPQAEQPPYKLYREVLEEVVLGFGERLRFVPSAAERAYLHTSLPNWPPFSDTVEALAALARRYRLAAISNTDDGLFAATAIRLQTHFDWVITAQQVGAYKPAQAMFKQALRRIGLPRDRILHVAESTFHDIAPARAMGIATVWVNRSQGRVAASRRTDAVPDLEVPDLKALAALAGVM